MTKRKLPKADYKSKTLSDSEDERSSNSQGSDSDTETDTSIQDYEKKRSKEKNKKERKKTSKKTSKEEKDEVEKISDRKENRKKKSRNERKEHDNDFLHDFDDITIDMTDESVSKKRIKLSYNLLLQCKMVDVNEKGRKFSYPALVFERKTKDGKNFEFNIPFNLSNRLINALNVMLTDSINIKSMNNEKK